ncbi:MAG: S8 family serine peptidase [Planctomycetes bacterium]|nr:S8 family serine peptidase [Planctomycetota bacterium]MBL7146052.1 S8 family serine peptidase [Phycisphaerae bacterium]
MKPFHKRKYRRLLVFILMATICLVFLDPAQFLKDRREPKIIAFVIDSASSMMEKERNILNLFEDLTHGQVVRSILRRYGEPDKLDFYSVDDTQGNIDGESYLNALTLIRNYLRDNPRDRVVINISLGSYSPKALERKLIKDILELGAIVVAAAGNDGVKDSIYPAALDGVICVGASGGSVRQSYSNYGDIDIFADGTYQTTQTLSLPSETGIETHTRAVKLNGTSFAAPKVSGLIVKMLQLKPSLENQQILEIIQNTSDEVLGFEQGSINRLNALAAISEKYAALRKTGQVFLIILEAICIIVFVCVGLLIVIPIPEFLFRVVFPSRWMAIKIRRIDRIMGNDRKRPRDIRYIINCLFPGYSGLFERANKALFKIGEPAVKHLIRAYPYKSCNEFGDFTTCIYNLIKEIGGSEAEEFLRSEQESQDDILQPDSQQNNEKDTARYSV